MDNPNRPQRRRMSALNERKVDHIRAWVDDSVDLQRDSFAAYRLRYNAMPELDFTDVFTKTEFAGKVIPAPLIISSLIRRIRKVSLLDWEAATRKGRAIDQLRRLLLIRVSHHEERT